MSTDPDPNEIELMGLRRKYDEALELLKFCEAALLGPIEVERTEVLRRVKAFLGKEGK